MTSLDAKAMNATLLIETFAGTASSLEGKGTCVVFASLGSVGRLDNWGIWTCWGTEGVL